MINRLDYRARTALLSSAALFAFVATPAFAQAQQQPAPQEDQTATPGDQTQDTADSDQASQTIIVTAQKRPQILLDVPVSISVVRGEQIQQSGASQLADYAAYVPGLQVDNAGSPGRSTLSLRGVAPIGPSATVGVYLDDAPIGSSGIYNRSQVFTLDLLPYDIDRLEVLRGPQGTLYGASSIGGLLKYVTVQPDLHRFKVLGTTEAFTVAHGDDLGWGLSALFNAPLVEDKLAVSGSYSRRTTPGYIDNIQTGKDDVNKALQEGGRAALLWRPDPALTVKLSAVIQTVKSDNYNIVYEGLGNTPLAPGAEFLSTNSQLPEPFTSKFHFYAGTIDYDFGFADLSSTTSHSDLKISETTDASRIFALVPGGFALFPATLHQKKWTEEIRLTSAPSDKFEWLLGVFYTDEDNTHDQIVHEFDANGDLLPPPFDPFAIVALPNTYKEYAVFGNATWKISDMFHLTGGLRWAHNDQTFTQVTQIPLLGLDIGGSGKSKESILTYSLSPQINFNKDTMVYARVAKGYRPGGPNVALPGFPATVGSETVTSYEAGIKTQILQGLVAFDGAAYYLDWKDLQVGAAFSNGINGLVNAGSARSTGFEAALFLHPAAGLSLGANFAYTDAQCTETTNFCNDGDRLPSIPKVSGALTADYSFHVSGSAQAHVGGALHFIGDRVSDVQASGLSIPVDGYATLDLNASVRFHEKWTVRAYARNLTDSEGRISSGLSTPNPGFIATIPVQPRTIGLALDVAL